LIWLDQTVWEKQSALSEKEINEVSECLVRAGVLDQVVSAKNLMA